MKKELPFKYKSRIYRVVWQGLGVVRLQDNHGDTHVVSKQRLAEMKHGLHALDSTIFNQLTF